MSEYFLPDAQRTIKPQQLGGFAGVRLHYARICHCMTRHGVLFACLQGRKYLCRGVLFKLTSDNQMPNGTWLCTSFALSCADGCLIVEDDDGFRRRHLP